jgi:hypothetical protein
MIILAVIYLIMSIEKGHFVVIALAKSPKGKYSNTKYKLA